MTPLDQIRERAAELGRALKMLAALEHPARDMLQARHDALIFAADLLQGAPAATRPPAAVMAPGSSTAGPAVCAGTGGGRSPPGGRRNDMPTVAVAEPDPKQRLHSTGPWTLERLALAETMWRNFATSAAIVAAVNRLPGAKPLAVHPLNMKAHHAKWPSRRRGSTAVVQSAIDVVGAAEAADPTDEQDEAEACEMIAQHKPDEEIAEYFGWSVPRIGALRATMIAAGTYAPKPITNTESAA